MEAVPEDIRAQCCSPLLLFTLHTILLVQEIDTPGQQEAENDKHADDRAGGGRCMVSVIGHSAT
jgi:hypothetical protein